MEVEKMEEVEMVVVKVEVKTAEEKAVVKSVAEV